MSSGKIYTKTGDSGTTGIIGGKRVEKHNPRLEAYGTIDELCASLGVLLSYPIDDTSKESIIRIQKHLFVISSCLATESSETTENHYKHNEKETEFLESEIDRMEKSLPHLKSFIVPGGHLASAQCNLARTVCRRAERRICAFFSDSYLENNIISYINRLSDYLFVLARFVE